MADNKFNNRFIENSANKVLNRRSLLRETGAVFGAVLLSGSLAQRALAQGGEPQLQAGQLPRYNRAVPVTNPHAPVLTSFDKVPAQGSLTPYSSGHCFAGTSLSGDGVLDARNLNQITIDPDRAQMRVGAGARLGQINAAADAYGLALPAGYCQTVAIGGHVQAGGIGVLSREYGLTCDHLLAAQVRLADGRQVWADDTRHSDLFWALRGAGGGSFSFLEQLVFQLRPVGRCALVYMAQEMDAADAGLVLEKWQEITAQSPTFISHHGLAYALGNGRVVLTLRQFASQVGPETVAVARALFALLTDIPSATQAPETPRIFEGTYGAMADTIWPRDLYGARRRTHACEMAARALPAAALAQALAAMSPETALILEPLGGAIVSKAGGAFAHRGATAKLQWSRNVAEDETQAQIYAGFAATRAALQPHCTGGVYAGYPDPYRPRNDQWLDSTPGLQQVKQTYDPQNRFRHAVSVPLPS